MKFDIGADPISRSALVSCTVSYHNRSISLPFQINKKINSKLGRGWGKGREREGEREWERGRGRERGRERDRWIWKEERNRELILFYRLLHLLHLLEAFIWSSSWKNDPSPRSLTSQLIDSVSTFLIFQFVAIFIQVSMCVCVWDINWLSDWLIEGVSD